MLRKLSGLGGLLALLQACGGGGSSQDGSVADGAIAEAGAVDARAGDGSIEASTADAGPPLMPLDGVVKVSVGITHACALRMDGTIYCWGGNQAGQLGDGTLDSRAYAEPVTGLDGAAAVSAGGFHSCALSSDGHFACWGSNTDGQLANHSTTSLLQPSWRGGIETEISAGANYTCVLLRNMNGHRRAYCAGDNMFGQLGDGTTNSRDHFGAVTGSLDATHMDAGSQHTCLVRPTGVISCWGFNAFGQLGVGDRVNRTTPTDVTGITDGVAVTPGDSHTCALHGDGSVSCWGENYRMAVGVADTRNFNTPQAVPSLSGITLLDAGGDHTCALDGAGAVHCWGRNNVGQLGDGTTDSRVGPVDVMGLSGSAVDVSAGRLATCAVLDNGNVACWGSNHYGQLGDGTTQDRMAPVTVLTPG